MGRASPALVNFNAGELSPRIEGRVDVGKYANGCKLLENFIPLVQGPAARRGGTRFVSEVKDSGDRTWLVKFEFNVLQSYVLEFGDGYIRFYTNNGVLLTGTVTAYSAATGYVAGDLASSAGVNYYCIAPTMGNAPPNASYWYPLTGDIYEIPTPYTAADLTNSDGTLNLRFVESADVVYIAHSNYAPRKLSRNSAAQWTISTAAFQWGPFQPQNIDPDITVVASARTGGISIIATDGIFTSANIDQLFYIEQKSINDVLQWEAGKAITAGAIRRSDGKNYQAINAATTGGVRPVHAEGALYDGDAGVQWQFLDPGYGYAQITSIPTFSSKVVNAAANNGAGLIRLTTTTAHGFLNGQSVTVANVGGTTEANGQWVITLVSTTQFDLQKSTFTNAYTAGGTAVTTTGSMAQATVIKALPIGATYAQTSSSAIASVSNNGSGLVRITTTAAHAFANGDQLTVSGVIRTVFAGFGMFGASIYEDVPADDVNGTWIATGVTGTTVDLVASVYSSSPSAPKPSSSGATVAKVSSSNATTRWAFGAWSDAEGWPEQVTFYKERLVWARDQTIWMSVSGDYENHADRDDGGIVTADSAITITLQSDQVNKIRWMSPYDTLVVGTAGGEFAVQPITVNQVFGPDNVTAPQVSAFGSKNMVPVRVGPDLLFIQKSGLKLRTITYNSLSTQFESVDKTILADHITKGGVLQIAYQQEPHYLIWGIRADGQLLGFTFNREQEVEGWHRHIIGGDGIVEAICTVPSPTGERDDLWMIVRRTINGVTRRYVEYMVQEHYIGDAPADSFYVDSGLTYSGAPATVISGLTHLEGATVSILVDGATHPDRVVTAGAITLQAAASVVQIGFRAPAKLQTMRLNAGAQDGTAQGKTARINKLTVRFLETLGLKQGPSFSKLDTIDFRATNDDMDAPPPLFTGDRVIDFDADYDNDPWVCLQQDDPLPCQIVGLFPQVGVQDR